MKSKNILLMSAIFIMISIGLVIISAEVLIGNKSYNLDTTGYGPSQQITGWINISAKNEPANLLLQYSNQSISFKDFLDKNGFHSGIEYSCFPIDCKTTYSGNGSESDSKTFSINEDNSKIIGMKITGPVEDITGFRFNISTDAKKSCIYPLKIDLLNDGLYEWKADLKSSEDCFIEKPYGCFNVEGVKSSARILAKINNDKIVYCEKTRIPPVKWFKIGAKVTGTGTAGFKFSIKTPGAEKACADTVVANQTGEISCIAGLDEELAQFTDAEICMQVDGDTNPDYNISYEDYSACGYSQAGSNTPILHDFEIFVYPLKYESLSQFSFDQDLVGNEISLATNINNYISSKYNKNCTPECIIPVRITSGINQQLTVSNLKLDYTSQNLPYTKNKFYEVSQSQPVVNLGFRKLDLGKANFLAPSSYGTSYISLMLGSNEIFRQNISIKRVPIINYIVHTPAIALIPATFYVYMENTSNMSSGLTFDWDFGDGDKQTTSSKTAKHTYSKTGIYDVSVKAIKEGFSESTKTIKVSVVPPKEGVASSLKEYKNDLNNISLEIASLPQWIRNEINKKIDIDDLNAKIKVQEENYKGAVGDEYTKVMQDLLAIKVPYRIKVSQKISNMRFIPNREQFDIIKIENVQGITLDDEGEETEDKYFSAVNNWLSQNINVSFESQTYSVYYKEGDEEDLLSYVKVTLSPEVNVADAYVLINGDPNQIKFNDETDLNTRQIGEDAIAVIFLDMGSETKQVEFLYPVKISAAALPFYISPDLTRDVQIVDTVGKCNNNGKCEAGEDYKNCRKDCKPWTLTLVFIIVLLLVLVLVYIVLQEWYKRKYESYLFKDKNQLFNLINYMNNASAQRQTKEQIFLKLKEYKWTKEQLEFAWRKLKGERTGMWEIPIFKWLEKKRVKQELSKRKGNVNVVKPGVFRPGSPGTMQPKR